MISSYFGIDLSRHFLQNQIQFSFYFILVFWFFELFVFWSRLCKLPVIHELFGIFCNFRETVIGIFTKYLYRNTSRNLNKTAEIKIVRKPAINKPTSESETHEKALEIGVRGVPSNVS